MAVESGGKSLEARPSTAGGAPKKKKREQDEAEGERKRISAPEKKQVIDPVRSMEVNNRHEVQLKRRSLLKGAGKKNNICRLPLGLGVSKKEGA